MINEAAFLELAYRAKAKKMPKNNNPNFLLLGRGAFIITNAIS
jgi:hypothetical protein